MRGFAPLPSGRAREGKADARRWAEFEEFWGLGLHGSEELCRRHGALTSPGHGSPSRLGRLRPLPLMRFFEIQKSEI